MPKNEQARIQDLNGEIKEILLQRLPAPEFQATAIPGFVIVRREDKQCVVHGFGRPLASLIVQGKKRTTIGASEFELSENQSVVAAVDLPSNSLLLNASANHPFLSMFFSLDHQVLSDLLMEQKTEPLPGDEFPGVGICDAEPEFMEGMLRLLRLLDKPEQIKIRAPLILRELHYLLLAGPLKGLIHDLYSLGGKNHQIINIITHLKQNISRPLKVEDLARKVNMSASSLHRHFKLVTGMSPMQYHKQLRLHEAQRLMLTENERAANAAFSVGYESVTQFSREYKKMFGQPPHRDILRRQRLPLAL